MTDPDAIVVGAGPNGLVAAIALARAGLRTLVVEAHPRRAGGAVGTEELTLPGFHHDVGAAFFPFGASSPAFRALDLSGAGLAWRHARYESCHPALDGTVATIARGADAPAPFGSARDTATFAALARRHAELEPVLLAALLGPFPTLGPLARLGPRRLFWLARALLGSGRTLAMRWFESEAARRVIPSLGLHIGIGPDDVLAGALGAVLALTATTGGYAVPEGGAGALAAALEARLSEAGGALRLNARVARIIVRDGRTVAVQLGDGTEIGAARAVVADTAVTTLLLDLVESHAIPAWVRARLRRFEPGPGTFKVDWALSGPVPWRSAEAAASAVVHTGESVDDVARTVRLVADGRLPDQPAMVVGQQSLADPTRAPPGRHTLYAYTHVPARLAGGWNAARDRFADRLEARLEGLAPGFRATILARHISAPPELEASNPNLIGGDLGGGANTWHRQLLFRPFFPYFRYRMPVRGLYLCSSYAHPGTGIHGMCGANAAEAVLHDLD